MQLRQMRAEPSPAPTVKLQNTAYSFTNSLAAHCRGGALLHPKSFAAPQGLSGRALLAPTIELQKSDIFLRKPCLLLVGACLAGLPKVHQTFGTPRSPPIRAKTFFYSTKKTRKFIACRSLLFGAPSAGAFRKQCSALFLATGPRELNASCIAAQREAAP